MTKNLMGWLAFLSMGFSYAVSPKEPNTADSDHLFQMGLGISMGVESSVFSGHSESTAFDLPNLYFPITFSKKVRIEPFFGYHQHKSGDIWTHPDSSDFQFGAGLFYLPDPNDIHLYVGIRVGMTHSTFGPEENTTAKGVFAGPAFGGEYKLSKRFSIGLETAWFYLKPNMDLSGYEIVSKNHFFVRLFFL